jgi:hypothetical protein
MLRPGFRGPSSSSDDFDDEDVQDDDLSIKQMVRVERQHSKVYYYRNLPVGETARHGSWQPAERDSFFTRFEDLQGNADSVPGIPGRTGYRSKNFFLEWFCLCELPAVVSADFFVRPSSDFDCR